MKSEFSCPTPEFSRPTLLGERLTTITKGFSAERDAVRIISTSAGGSWISSGDAADANSGVGERLDLREDSVAGLP